MRGEGCFGNDVIRFAVFDFPYTHKRRGRVSGSSQTVDFQTALLQKFINNWNSNWQGLGAGATAVGGILSASNVPLATHASQIGITLANSTQITRALSGVALTFAAGSTEFEVSDVVPDPVPWTRGSIMRRA